jgi:hypothetical protein
MEEVFRKIKDYEIIQFQIMVMLEMIQRVK